MSIFLSLAFVHLLALASPGPDFLFVTQAAISRSRRQALWGVAGIVLGIAVWAALALLGLHVLLQRVAWLQRAITFGGGLYLLWLGGRLLLAAVQWQAPVAASRLPAGSDGALFRAGLLTNLSNAKAVVYFASVFSAFAGALGGGARGALWLLVVAESLGWFALVALLFSLPQPRRAYLRAGRWIDAGAGLVFAGFGVHLLRGG